MAIYCMNCGASLPDGAAFCDACGTPVRGQRGTADGGMGASAGAPPASYSPDAPGGNGAAGAGSVVCPVCGAAAIPGEAFCDNCGAALMPSGSYTSSPAPAPVSSSSFGASPAPASMPQPSPAAQTAQSRSASLVITSPAPPATLQVPDRAEMIVGRSDPQSNSYPDVDLGPYGGLDLGVSRRHFRLSRTGDQFYIEDLSSVNGTVVNGQRIPAHNLHPLRPGDRISLGKMEMTFELS